MIAIDTPVQALGWALLHFLWQGALVGVVAAMALAMLRDARPQARYLVACAALIACVALPLATLARGPSPAGAPAAVVVAPAPAPVAAAAAATPVELPGFVDSVALRERLTPRLPTIVALWSLGAALLALRMGLGLAWVARVGDDRHGRRHAAWQARLDALAASMRLSTRVALRIVDDLDTPAVARVLRPVVLVPATLLTRMPADLLEALLAHELAHVRRHDYLVNLLQGIVEALLFYHPVVWWLSRRVRRERELIADDLAARAIGDPRRLARALDALAALQPRPEPTPTLALAAAGGDLMSRISRLVRPRREALRWQAALPVIGISVLCLSFAQARPDDAPRAAGGRSVVHSVLDTPAAPAGSSTGTRGTIFIDDDADRDSYALLDGDDADGLTYLSGNTDDLERIRAMRRDIDGGFLWVRRDGREYIGSDARLLAGIRAAWAKTEPASREMEGIGAEMEKHGETMEAIGKRMESQAALGETDAAEMEAIGERISAAGAKQADVAAQIARLSHVAAFGEEDAERERAERDLKTLEATMDGLGAEMDRLGAQMERHATAMERAHAPLEAIGAEMERASAPMEALGKQMEVLGEQIERYSEEADAQTRAAIDQALRDGRLVPIERHAAR